MGTQAQILDVVRASIGRRHKITRQEMADLLSDLGRLHLVELDNGWQGRMRGQLPSTIFDERRDDDLPEDPAAAWTAACNGLTVISVLADDDPVEPRLRSSNSGSIRYDDPGSMHPMLRATIMFVWNDANVSLDPLRQRAQRVLLVAGEPEAAVDPFSQPRQVGCECDHGHRWRTDDPERDWACPTCGEPAV